MSCDDTVGGDKQFGLGQSCTDVCPFGTFEDDEICNSCTDGCMSCDNTETCITCSGTHDLDDSGKCVPK